MAREAMVVCLRVLKESNKSRFYSYSARKSALIISHITFRDCRVHSFSDNLSRNSCKHLLSTLKPVQGKLMPNLLSAGSKAREKRPGDEVGRP